MSLFYHYSIAIPSAVYVFFYLKHSNQSLYSLFVFGSCKCMVGEYYSKELFTLF